MEDSIQQVMSHLLSNHKLFLVCVAAAVIAVIAILVLWINKLEKKNAALQRPRAKANFVLISESHDDDDAYLVLEPFSKAEIYPR